MDALIAIAKQLHCFEIGKRKAFLERYLKESENMQKGSGYSAKAGYYAEIICLSTLYWDLRRKFSVYSLLTGFVSG
jgi:hypothetical protein